MAGVRQHHQSAIEHQAIGAEANGIRQVAAQLNFTCAYLNQGHHCALTGDHGQRPSGWLRARRQDSVKNAGVQRRQVVTAAHREIPHDICSAAACVRVGGEHSYELRHDTSACLAHPQPHSGHGSTGSSPPRQHCSWTGSTQSLTPVCIRGHRPPGSVPQHTPWGQVYDRFPAESLQHEPGP